MRNTATSIRFEEGLDYGIVRSTCPDVINDICGLSRADSAVVVENIDLNDHRIEARVPLAVFEAGQIFRCHREIRQLAYAGCSGSVHISH